METANYKTLNQLYNFAKENNIINKDKSFANFVDELKKIFEKEYKKNVDENKEMFISYANNFIDNLAFVNNLNKNYKNDGDEEPKKNNLKIDTLFYKSFFYTFTVLSSLTSITLLTLYLIDRNKNQLNY